VIYRFIGKSCKFTHFYGWCGGHFHYFRGTIEQCKVACSARTKCRGIHYRNGQCWLQDFACSLKTAGAKGNKSINQYTKSKFTPKAFTHLGGLRRVYRNKDPNPLSRFPAAFSERRGKSFVRKQPAEKITKVFACQTAQVGVHRPSG
jgi:hypothetical protein